MTPIFRPGTVDKDVWEAVNTYNEYRLPDSMADWTVLDIGAHIGAFTHACAGRGANLIFACEAHLENFRICFENTLGPPYTNLFLFHKIAWGDIEAMPFGMGGWPNIGTTLNTGGGSPDWDMSSPNRVGAVKFQELIEWAMQNHSNQTGRVDLVKLDCEGSEWPILFALDQAYFGCIDRIYGEYHEKNILYPVNGREDYKAQDIISLLEPLGFDVEAFPHGNPEEGLGMFFANRK